MPEHRKKGKSGTHKYGRNAVKCAAYRNNHYRTNKLVKLRKHLKVHHTDHTALTAYHRLR